MNNPSENKKVIGVLSDTHLNRLDDCAALAEELLKGVFADIHMILHAGDHTCPEFETCFYPVPFISVRGNMDHTLTDLPQWRMIDVCDKKIGLIHGWGDPGDMEQRILNIFAGKNPDVIVFGHTHYPVCHRQGGTLLFNPGSPTDKRGAPFRSVGLLEVGEEVRGHIIRFE